MARTPQRAADAAFQIKFWQVLPVNSMTWAAFLNAE
jgi:hypothetical protein